MGNDLNQNLKNFENSYAAETTCLIAQAIVTVAVIYNLERHWRKFPIKQLSPLCTLVALISFFLLNVISVFGRWAETYNEYYVEQECTQSKQYFCGQCRVLITLNIYMMRRPLYLLKNQRPHFTAFSHINKICFIELQ